MNVYAAGAGFWLIRDANNPNDPGNAGGIKKHLIEKLRRTAMVNETIRKSVQEQLSMLPLALTEALGDTTAKASYPGVVFDRHHMTEPAKDIFQQVGVQRFDKAHVDNLSPDPSGLEVLRRRKRLRDHVPDGQ